MARIILASAAFFVAAACSSGPVDLDASGVSDVTVDVRSNADALADAPVEDSRSDVPDADAGHDPDTGDPDLPDAESDPDADAVPDAPNDADTTDTDADVVSDTDGGDIADADAGMPDVPDLDTAPDVEDAEPDIVSGIAERPLNTTCVAGPAEEAFVETRFDGAFGRRSFEEGVVLLQEPSPSGRWYVGERAGFITYFDVDRSSAATATFLDIRDRIDVGVTDHGILGAAFHPRYPRVWEVYVSYVAASEDPPELRVSRFDVGFTGGEPDSEQILLTVPLDHLSRIGGQIAFGPDRYLYVTLGDLGDSVGGVAQDTDDLLGSILRIDVDAIEGELPYAIPPTNPFAEGGGAPEIFAWGFSHPTGISFDRETGTMWVTDRSAGAWQEVNRVELGGNYGWPVRDGSDCFRDHDDCDSIAALDPVVGYDEAVGRNILGGFSYRGEGIEELAATYLFTDRDRGELFGLFPDADTGELERQFVTELDDTLIAIAESAEGELYGLTSAGGGVELIRIRGTAAVMLPELLSEVGCFDPDDPSIPLDVLIPFEPSAPFWSDGAVKRRWFALPEGATIETDGHGDFIFPPGTVLAKDFQLDGRMIETRFLLVHESGEWSGWSYEWNEEGTDATIVPAGAVRTIDGQPWLFPSSAECMQCHASAADRSLGPETIQLDWEITYPSGVTANQLDTLLHIGVLDERPRDIEPLPDPFGDADIISRGRAWLHTNCSGCHRPDGPEPAPMDFRWTVPDINACNVAARTSFGIPDARIILPGDPDNSVLITRISRRLLGQMPPLGSFMVDEQGVELMRAFVESDYCELYEGE